MGRHSHDDGPVTGDWEEPPPVAPLWRARIVTSAVLLLAVIAGTWWAVSWLTSPAGPGGVGAPQAAALDGQAVEGGAGQAGAEQVHAVEDGTAQGGFETGGPGSAESGQAGAGGTGEGTSGEGEPRGEQSGTAGAGSHEVLIVHVAGEVHEPGLVELPAGARVADALSAAGGPTTRAELDRLNLAAPAVDASQILVPGPDTPPPAAGNGTGPGTAGQPGSAGSDGSGAAAGTGLSDGTVNVNTADAATLEQLPGIGPALAARIIEHRERVGPYGSLADLNAVSGIGPAMMERLDGLVSW